MAINLEKLIEENQNVLAIVVGTTTCTTCMEWVPNVLSPACESLNVPVITVYMDIDFIPTPSPFTPTTYFYVKGHRDPMIITGPEPIEQIIDRLEACFTELEKTNN